MQTVHSRHQLRLARAAHILEEGGNQIYSAQDESQGGASTGWEFSLPENVGCYYSMFTAIYSYCYSIRNSVSRSAMQSI